MDKPKKTTQDRITHVTHRHHPNMRCCVTSRIDGVSSFLTFIGLCVTLHFWRLGTTPVAATWHEKVIFTKNKALTDAALALKTQLKQTCTSGDGDGSDNGTGAYTLFLKTEEWGSEMFTGMPVAIVDTGFQQWACLFFVLLVSWACQAARWYLSNHDFYGFTYRPSRGPDFWRWFEYILTSPLQIVLVCSAFQMGERNMLVLIAALQAGLVLGGYLIEIAMESVCVGLISEYSPSTVITTAVQVSSYQPVKAQPWMLDGAGKDSGDLYDDHDMDNDTEYANVLSSDRLMPLKLLLIVLICNAFHVVIWTVILVQFSGQAIASNRCSEEDDDGMPWFVWLIVVGQFIFFTLFGIVSFMQWFYVVFRFRLAPTVESKRRMWMTMAFRYSILSVSAKLFLEVGFIAFASMN